ncbi:MAG: orotate phosphoribosyltransferase [Gammaproteobacteria bacterium]|nr:orotate phosphoribosyltransferase [Gammaproteobacteria bacterium]
MKPYQQEFIRFALDCKALQFGEFKLKSGRISPYFFNGGQFNNGETLSRLGEFYAHALIDHGLPVDVLYGPAYKGIPLVCALAIALFNRHDRSFPYTFNRKEAKDHGEGGVLVGAPLLGKILIVDDVITAGTSVNESVQVIQRENATPAGVLIALDRQERLADGQSAIHVVEKTHAIPVISIINFNHIYEFVSQMPEYASYQSTIVDYRREFGIPG